MMRIMKIRLIAALLAAFAVATLSARADRDPSASAVADLLAQAPAHAECSHLMMLKLPDVKITESVSVPAAATGAITVPYCRVNGVIGTEIKFTLLLPDTWNHKLLMGGGGGFVGILPIGA